MTTLFENKFRDLAASAIRRLIENRNQKGWAIHKVEGVKHGVALNLSNQADLRALSIWSGGTLNNGRIIQVLSDLIDANSNTASDFEAGFYRGEPRSPVRALKEHTWQFLIPWFIQCKSDVSLPVRFSAIGTRFTLHPWLPRPLKSRAAIVQKSLFTTANFRSDHVPEYCLVTSQKGATAEATWQRVESSFDLFIGFVELTLGFMRFTMHAPEQPMRYVHYPPWLLAWNRDLNTVESFNFSVSESEVKPERRHSFNRHMLDGIVENLSRFSEQFRKAPDISLLLGNAFRLYAQALHSPRHWQAFLGFWQCAEALSVGEKYGGDSRRLCTRIAALASPRCGDRDAVAAVLNELYKVRNEVVHQGIHSRVGLEDLNLLKNYCEAALVWMIDRCHEIKTKEHLDRFFEFQSLNDSGFLAVNETIRIVKRWRKPAKAK